MLFSKRKGRRARYGIGISPAHICAYPAVAAAARDAGDGGRGLSGDADRGHGGEVM